MAKLIPTGEIEAIDLKFFHSKQLIALEKIAAKQVERNGGFGRLVLWLKRGVLEIKAELCEFVLLSDTDTPPIE